MENFICVCGKEFKSIKALSGHKASCKEFYLQRDGNLDGYFYYIKRHSKSDEKIKKEKEKLENWISEQHKCERCGKVMTEYFGSGRFCSKACANAHDYADETRKKIGLSVSKYNTLKKYSIKIKEYNEDIYYKNPNKCVICGNILTYKRRFFKTCCKECYSEYQRNIHKNILPVKRSKNEILFCNLCEEFFGKENVLNNEKMFNGWDADIIIPKLKIAILWNGPWHYVKVTEKTKLKQIQIRDSIKLEEIRNSNYIPYIIKDMGNENFEKVKLEFGLFLDYLIDNYII